MSAMKRITAGLLAVLALGMTHAHAELRGTVHKVVNPQAPRAEWRRVPMPHAYVTVEWSVTIPAPGHAITSCRYSELARTDEKGEYVMAGPNFVTAGIADTRYAVYAPGLRWINFPHEGSPITPKDITLAPSRRSPEDRLSSLSANTAPGCGDPELSDPRGLIVPYLRAMLDEAKALKVDTPRGRDDVAHIESALRRASGLDKPQPLRAVPVPAPGAVQSATPK